MSCIFCKIVAGEIPSKKVYEDDEILAFNDVSPAAPVHVLVIPKQHMASAAEITDKDAPLIGHIFTTIAKLAKELELAEGFRVVTNCGENGGQTVDHLHFHLIGGRKLDTKMC